MMKKVWLNSLLVVLLPLSMAACTSVNSSVKSSNDVSTNFTESPVREKATIHAQLGSAYYRHGQMAIAKDEFERSASIDPSYEAPFSGLGLVYSSLGMVDKAEANFKKAISLAPGNSESHNNYGAFLCANGKTKEAISEFNKALSNPLYQTPDLAISNAGDCSLKGGDLVNADKFYSRLVDKDPFNWSAQVKLGEIKLRRGDIKRAGEISALVMKNLDTPSPELLFLAINVSMATGDLDGASSYEMFLVNKYPTSREAKNVVVNRKTY